MPNYSNYNFTTPSGNVNTLYADMLKQNHIVIGGSTGSGKSVLLHGLITTALHSDPNAVELVLIDLKRVEFHRYRSMPHIIGYADMPEDAEEVLKGVCGELERRMSKMLERDLTVWEGGTVYVVIDELAELTDGNKEILKLLKRIARLGRACKIILICATQSPNRKTLPADLTLNFNAQLCLRCRSSIESKQIMGFKGGECLPRYGHAYYMNPDKTYPELVDVELIPDEENRRIIEHWKNPDNRREIF